MVSAARDVLRRRPGRNPTPVISIGQAGSLSDDMQKIVQPSAAGNFLWGSKQIYTPERIQQVLTTGMYGNVWENWQLYQMMEDTWPRLAKNLLELKRAVSGGKVNVIPYRENKAKPTDDAIRRAAVVRAALDNMSPDPGVDANDLEGTLFDLMDCWFKGVSVLEIDWETMNHPTLGSIVAPKQTRWINPVNYGFAWESGQWGLAQNVGTTATGVPDQKLSFAKGNFIPFPEDKFLFGTMRAKTGNPTGAALARPLAFWWAVQNFTADWMLRNAELFGIPIRIATYDKSDPSLRAILETALKNMGSSGWVAMPEGTNLQLLENKGGGKDDPGMAAFATAQKLCDLIILGQTLTTDVGQGGGGSHAMARVHEGVRAEILTAARRLVLKFLKKQLVRAIIRKNFGNVVSCPDLISDEESPEDSLILAQRDNILLQNGIRMPAAWFFERHGIPEPDGDEPTVGGGANLALGNSGTPGGDMFQTEGGWMANTDKLGKDGKKKGDMKNVSAANQPDPGPQAAGSNAQSELAGHMAEDLTGLHRTYIARVQDYIEGFIRMANDPQISDGQFLEAIDNLAANAPREIAPLLNRKAVADKLHDYMSSSILNGALVGSLRRRQGVIDSMRTGGDQ